MTDLDTDCEITCSLIELANNKPLFIGSFYRSPSSDDQEEINKQHESISKITCKNASLPNIILNGGFNTPDINWENSSIHSKPYYYMGLNNSMVDFVNAISLSQTRNDNILDLTMTTNPDLITDLETHPGISDHCAVTYNVNLTVKRRKKPDRYVYQYGKET